MLAFRQAGLGAGRLNCRINDLGMSLGGDHFLGNEYSIADGAVLAFRQARLGAGRSLCCVNDFGVPLGWNDLNAGEDAPQTEHFMPALWPGSVQVAGFSGI